MALCGFAQNLPAVAIMEEAQQTMENAQEVTEEAGESAKLEGKLTRKEIYSADNRIESRLNATAQVEVITLDDIEAQNSPTLSNLMNQVSGVTVQRTGAVGDRASFRIRGNDRVKVLIDGVKANDLNDSKFYLDDFMSDDIERIEIVKGPSGNMGGSQASGGLVGIFTRRGEGSPRFKIESSMGAYGTFKERASFGGGNEKSDFYLSTTFLKTDGGARLELTPGRLTRIEDDYFKSFNLVGNFGHRLFDGKGEIRNITRLSNSDKGSGYVGQVFDNNNYTKNFNINNTSIFDFKPNEWYDSSNRIGIYSNTYNFYQNPDEFFTPDENQGKFSYRGSRVNVATQHNFNYKNFNKLSIGYNMEYEKFISDSAYGATMWGPATFDKYWGSSFQHDFYANDTINIKDVLFLKGGARFSENSIYGSFVSPNASAALVLPTFNVKGAHSKLRGSWGRSFNTPTFSQRFAQNDWQIPNPNLAKEQFEGWDAGFEQSFFDEKLVFDLGYFNNKYKDYIGWQDDPNWGPGTYINVNRAKINGYEMGVSWQPTPKFKTSLNYTYTKSEDLTTGYQLPAVPNNRVNITSYYTPNDRLSLYASVGASSSRVYGYDYTTKEPKNVGGYADVSLGGKLKLQEGKKTKTYLTLQIFNLLNQKISMYQGIYHPGVSFLLGLNIEFGSNSKEKVETL